MTLPKLSISSADIEIDGVRASIEVDGVAYVEIQMRTTNRHARKLSWPRIVDRITDIALKHSGDKFKRNGAPLHLIRKPLLRGTTCVMHMHLIDYRGQFDTGKVEPFQLSIGRMLGEDYGIDRVNIIVHRY